MGLALPRDDEGVGDVRFRFLSPFLRPDALVRIRFREAAAWWGATFLDIGAFFVVDGRAGCADPARLEAGTGVPAFGVPDDGPSEDCLRAEDCVGMLPLSEVFKRRRFAASALLSLCDRAAEALR